MKGLHNKYVHNSSFLSIGFFTTSKMSFNNTKDNTILRHLIISQWGEILDENLTLIFELLLIEIQTRNIVQKFKIAQIWVFQESINLSFYQCKLFISSWTMSIKPDGFRSFFPKIILSIHFWSHEIILKLKGFVVVQLFFCLLKKIVPKWRSTFQYCTSTKQYLTSILGQFSYLNTKNCITTSHFYAISCDKKYVLSYLSMLSNKHIG